MARPGSSAAIGGSGGSGGGDERGGGGGGGGRETLGGELIFHLNGRIGHTQKKETRRKSGEKLNLVLDEDH
jgi:hypothetical protein